MSEKAFSIGKAIRKVLDRGGLTGVERELHYSLQRETERMPELNWMRGANDRGQSLYAPIELFTRQLSTATFPIEGAWKNGN